MRQPQRGFTLVEMMVVVAIIMILVSIMFGINAQTWGGNPSTVSDELSSALNSCKMRAVSTRRWHRCEVTPSALTTYQWSSTGMLKPVGTYCTSGQPPPACWQYVQNYSVPNGITVWDGTTTTCVSPPCSGAPGGANTGLVFDFDFRPDGSSSGGTIFVSDSVGNRKNRVVVYTATGSSYQRSGW